jgi:hypothetical protein
MISRVNLKNPIYTMKIILPCLLFFGMCWFNQSIAQQTARVNDNLQLIHVMPKVSWDAGKPGKTFEVKFSVDECYHVYAYASRIEIRKFTKSVTDPKAVDPVISKIYPEAGDFGVLDVIALGEKIMVLVECMDKKQIFMSAYEIDMQTLMTKGKPKRLFEMTNENLENFKTEIKRENSGQHNSDKLIVQTIKHFKDGKNEVWLNVYDAELTQIMARKINFPTMAANFVPDKLFFKDENSFLFSGAGYEENGLNAEKNSGKIRVFYFSKMGDLADELKVKIDGVEVSDFDAIIQNDEIILAGFYGSNQSGRPTGCFYQKIDCKNLAVKETVKNELNAEITNGLLARSKNLTPDATDQYGEKAEFNFTSLSVTPNGSVYMTAEDIYRVAESQVLLSKNSIGYTGYYKTYHYNTILAAKIAPDKTQGWCTVLDKAKIMHDVNPKYTMFTYANSMAILYNGSLRDFDGSLDKNVTGNSVPAIMTFSEKGNTKKEILKLPESNKSVTFHDESFRILTGGEIVFKLSDVTGSGYYLLKM